MDSSAKSFDGILEDLLMVPTDRLEEAVRAYSERFPKHRQRLQDFVADAAVVDRYFAAAAAKKLEPPPLSTERFPRYDIFEEIGRGSQGVIYRAQQTGIGRTVALKVLRHGALASAKEWLRFENEIQLISRLRHPNIVTIYDYGLESDQAYFAMEYVQGQRLDIAIAGGKCAIAYTLQVFLQIADAVSCAHQQGIIHRDLKPTNILIDSQGKPHILDFGLAKAIDEPNKQPITEFGVFTGTWPYASPEQVMSGESVTDVRSDVYTLGVLLFEMLTGKLPYPTSGERQAIRENILTTLPDPPSALREGISDDLDTIVLRTLAKEPERRYQSAAALRDDVQRCLRNEAIEAKRDSRCYVLRKTVDNYRWHFRAAFSALLALVAFTVVITWLYADVRKARATTEARMNVVRIGQRDTHDRFRELHILANVAEGYKSDHPQAMLLARLRKPIIEFPQAKVSGPGEIPALPVDKMTTSARADLEQWVGARTAVLDSFVIIAQNHRFRFSNDEAYSPWMIDHKPSNLNETRTLCLALIVRAEHLVQEGAVVRGLSFLTTAQSIALDLADEPTYLYKGLALECRLHAYESLQGMIVRACEDRARLSVYKAWLENDPPMPALDYARLHERTKVLQYIEASIDGDASREGGKLNLDRLDELASGIYRQSGLLNGETRRMAEQMGPERIIGALDRFASPAALDAADREVLQLLWPFLPSLGGLANQRTVAEAARQAALQAVVDCTELTDSNTCQGNSNP